MARQEALSVWVGFALCTAAPALAVFDFDFHFDDTQEIVSLESLEEGHFKHTFTNTGTQTDTYEMIISSAQYHTGDENSILWTMCNSQACVLPGVLETITLGPTESDTLTFKTVPIFTEGSSTATITFRSQGSGETVTRTYGMIIAGTEAVIIDDDGGAGYETFVATGLAGAVSSYGIYDTTLQPLSDADFSLDATPTIVYIAGNQATSTITAGDAAFLSSYLNQGGHLIVSGQGVFDDISGGAFATTYLGASRTATQAGQFNVQTIAASPLQSDDTFVINAGAGNQTSQDALTGPIPCFRYGNGTVAGVCRDNGTYRTVSLGFGLEAVGQGGGTTGLTGLFTTFLGWFDSALGLPDVVTGLEPAAIRAVVAPNPMRGPGHLRLALPGDSAAPVRVTLYSVTGAAVRTLFEGQLPAGASEIAFEPTDRSGRALAPGVYRYRIERGGLSSAGSLTLLD